MVCYIKNLWNKEKIIVETNSCVHMKTFFWKKKNSIFKNVGLTKKNKVLSLSRAEILNSWVKRYAKVCKNLILFEFPRRLQGYELTPDWAEFLIFFKILFSLIFCLK